MLNRSASLAMSTSVHKALPGELDIKRHSPSILYLCVFPYVISFPTDPISNPNIGTMKNTFLSFHAFADFSDYVGLATSERCFG